MLHEMMVVGGAMSVVVTLVWLLLVILFSSMNSEYPLSESVKSFYFFP